MKRLLSSIHPRGLWWGFSLPHTLSSLHFLKPHSKCVSQGDCVSEEVEAAGSHVSSAWVSSKGSGGGSTGEDRRRSNCLAWWSALQWTETAVSLEKPSPTASCRLFLAIFLATLCLLNMHFMLHLHFSSPSREPLALTLLASRAVQHCALYKSQQP